MALTIFSILIYTEILNFLIYFFGYIYCVLIIYISLVIIGIIRFKEKCFLNNSSLDFIKIHNLNEIKDIRKKVTLLGIFLEGLCEFLRRRFIFIDVDISFIEYYNIYYLMEFFFFKNYQEELRGFKIICLPNYFYIYKNDGMWKEIKNRPSLYIYQNMVFSMYWVLTDFTIYMYIKLYELSSFNNNYLQIFNLIYEIELLKMKILLNYIWDVEYYIGGKMNIDFTWNNSHNFMEYEIINRLDSGNFLIENKKDNKFFDIYTIYK